MDEPISICAAGRAAAAYDDKVDVNFTFNELMLSYKYGEKARFKKCLDKLQPYFDDRLYDYFKYIYDTSTWTNPITGKKGY